MAEERLFLEMLFVTSKYIHRGHTRIKYSKMLTISVCGGIKNVSFFPLSKLR